MSSRRRCAVIAWAPVRSGHTSARRPPSRDGRAEGGRAGGRVCSERNPGTHVSPVDRAGSRKRPATGKDDDRMNATDARQRLDAERDYGRKFADVEDYEAYFVPF